MWPWLAANKDIPKVTGLRLDYNTLDISGVHYACEVTLKGHVLPIHAKASKRAGSNWEA